MGISFSTLKEKAKAERQRRDAIDARIARERIAEMDPATLPPPRWGDVGFGYYDRKAPWLRGLVPIILALCLLLAAFALAVWLVLWFAQ